jgi:uncharacterized protein
VTDPTDGPVPPLATEEVGAPAASATPSVSNTSDDPATPDGSTGSDAVVAVTPSEQTAEADGRAEELDADGPESADLEDEPVYTIPDPASSGVPEYRMALVSSVTLDLPSQHPTVLLRESESPRRQLTFSIGLQDGIVLSHAIRRIPTPRPLTHELLTNILQRFDVDVVAVRLVGRQGAIYFAELDLRGRTGRSVLSARPSDALTLALLQPVPVPILVDGRLFEVAGDVAPPA